MNEKYLIQNHIYDHNEFHNRYKEDIVYTPNGILYYKQNIGENNMR